MKIFCQKLYENNNEFPSLLSLSTLNQELYTNCFQIQKIKSDAISSQNYFLDVVNNFIFTSNFNTFYIQCIDSQFEPSLIKIENQIKITCSGLAVKPDSCLIAVGDMVGNIIVYQNQNNNPSNEKYAQFFIAKAVRSLEWHPRNDELFIGTMQGQIYKWNYENNNQKVKQVAYFQGGITSLRFKCNESDNNFYLLSSSTEEQFAILLEEENNYKILNLAYAHLPLESSAQFGSLGHLLAVTCIDWKQMNQQLSEIFISCSDDKTVKIYNPQQKFQLIHEFNTNFVNEWHTLTYLSLENGGTRVAIGYLFIYDLLNYEFQYCEKIHMGGIEGLIWKNNQIFTCSNDCFGVNKQKEFKNIYEKKSFYEDLEQTYIDTFIIFQ
ncbi:hypothetical protein IMG5_117520 [Ichthyophthirius multifiliis]|uniref:Uncharacterized protein n=1 Tax=Ichthyophthirius multifiliis TaxID=5932 RepID=G0QUI9_ICHMU|nr:hypothetical protein IMG5_117520 [Ichthyophthirius multifiliis]EGR31109.1 hypothetical protein IMG5_117520 [Ichthyophthirius multifiliis]|eukprot:XP_004034595.1 hypothetical protein IMG5_117520 [Ichthyophthirius multifiliis]